MGLIIDGIVEALVWLINWCYAVCHNYGVAILFFTFLSKVILMPLSVWVQKNSIKTVRMQPQMNHIKAAHMGNAEQISEEQYKLFKEVHYSPFADLIPLFVQLALLMGVVEAVKKGTPLTAVPMETLGLTLIVPLIAALSAFLMCYVQNKINVLQAEQGAWNQYGTMAFSVLLSLYLGFFVSIGVGIYWICSNLLSIVQLVILNMLINPKKYIDYEALEKSKEELAKAKEFMPSKKKKGKDPYHAKAKEDYKKFLSGKRKRIVFYSEKDGFYKYYAGIIEEIISKTNIVIHYITSDPLDKVFALESEQFKPYYIDENRLIVLLMKLESDIVVMTTPDLENFQLKRSYVKKDIEYIYVPHDVNSANLTFHKEALDHFDTIFSSGFKNTEEIRAREEKFGLQPKTIVNWGSGVIDNMIAAYGEGTVNEKTTVLIAPSWQKDNIMDLCLEDMLDQLKESSYQIIVRPHPQYVRHFEERIAAWKKKYADNGNIQIQTDFSSNSTVYSADILITDWSSIAFEYSFATLKPTLFINTPMKVMNPDYEELGVVPMDAEIRNKVGKSLEVSELGKINAAIEDLLKSEQFSKESMDELRSRYIYNIGNSGKVGAEYIIDRMLTLSEKR